jgi:hypothetical protein
MPSVTTPFTITLVQLNPEHSPARFIGRFDHFSGPQRLFLTKLP